MNDFLAFWFPITNGGLKFQSFWFDESRDKEIYDKFYSDLQKAEKLNIDHILNLSNDEKYYYLILFDQITRNTSRITHEDPYRNDSRALKIAENLLSLNYDSIIFFIKRIFILLPLRHSETIKNLDFVISRLNTYHSSLLENEKADYQRFYIATLKNYTNCKENISIIKPEPQDIIYNHLIHDSNCQTYTEKISNNIVINLNKNSLYQSILNYCRKYKINKVGVSLSGGVDSMVLLFILRQLVLNKEIHNVVAIHIDYHWRKESTQEAQYLVQFCNYLGIDIVLRNIIHFNSEVDTKIDIAREIVENETKMIRFNTYKFAIEKYNLEGICLGHHKDDLIENVFMNMSKGKNILDLFVTEEYTIQHDVYILRPMLEHHKEDIFEIAHANSIIYFKDTTPDWSFRGTMRKKIFPVMMNFDPLILNNLHRMGKQSAEWEKFIKNKIMRPILNSSRKYKNGLSFDMNIDYFDLPFSFWSELLANFFHSHGINMITQKNIVSFISWLERNNENEKLGLSNGYLVFTKKKRFYFIKTELFEKLKNELENIKFQINLEDFENKMILKMSMWNVEIKKSNTIEKSDIIISQESEKLGEMSELRMTYENILDGIFEYHVIVKDKFIIGLREKNKIFCDITLLTHLIPKINNYNKGNNVLHIAYSMG